MGKDSCRAAKGVRGPGDIQHEAVGRIGRDDRRVAAQRPAGELLQRGAIGIRFGIEDLEIGNERLSLRDRHTGDKTDCARRRIRRGQETALRSEEHTSELQSLMRISYAVFCLNNKRTTITTS